MSKRILVTGGAGFIGSHLVDKLLNAGHEVRVFDSLDPQVHGGLREQGRWPDYCSPDAEYVAGDVRDRDALAGAMRGMDVIYHEAAAVGVAQSMYDVARYADVNSHGTAVLLDLLVNDAAIRDRMQKLVVASSMSVYGEGRYQCAQHGDVYPGLRSREQLDQSDGEVYCPIGANGKPVTAYDSHRDQVCGLPVEPLSTDENKPLCCTSIYAITKRDQEEMCLTTGWACGIPTVALRYFVTYGSRQAPSNPYAGVSAIFCNRILAGLPPVVYEDGLQSRDLVHVSDIVQANLLVLENDDVNYGVFNVGTGRSVTILEMAQTLLDLLGSNLEPSVARTFRAGDVRHCFADIGRIQRMGFEPRVKFEDGVRDVVEWVRQHPAEDQFDRASGELTERRLTT